MIKDIEWMSYYNKFNELSNNKRIMLLILGWIIIYVIWYKAFASALISERHDLKSKIIAAEYENTRLNTEIGNFHINEERKLINLKMAEEELNVKKSPSVYLKTSSEQLMKQFFNLQNEIKSISLKNNTLSPTSFELQVQFNSGYFETMAYLVRLEQLPWCLSWDSLVYQVNNYPDASITINLHAENL